MAETKTHQRFRSRVEYLQMYLEAMDSAATITFNKLGKKTDANKSISDVLPIDATKYSKLNHPCSHRARIYNYCRTRNVQLAIIDIHRYFSEYIKDILKEVYDTNPMLIVSESNMQIKYIDLAKFSTLNEIHSKMVSEVFRSLESEQSTIKLIEKVIKISKLNIAGDDVKSVLPYLDMRHLIIHNQGDADKKFADEYGEIFNITSSSKLPMKFNVAEDAIRIISDFIKKMDVEFLRLALVKAVKPPVV